MIKRLLIIILYSISMVASANATEKISVFVSIVPQKYFVQQISKDMVDVKIMVKPGASPATYEPKPRQMAELSKAKLYFSIGVPFENAWLKKISAANPKNTIFILMNCLNLITKFIGSISRIRGKMPEPFTFGIKSFQSKIWTYPENSLSVFVYDVQSIIFYAGCIFNIVLVRYETISVIFMQSAPGGKPQITDSILIDILNNCS